MPRRSILSAAERENLLALPDTNDELIRSANPTSRHPDVTQGLQGFSGG